SLYSLVLTEGGCRYDAVGRPAERHRFLDNFFCIFPHHDLLACSQTDDRVGNLLNELDQIGIDDDLLSIESCDLNHDAASIAYLFRLTRSSSMLSDVVMTRALDWKPRWAMIMLVNSWARSTLADSSAPEEI